MERFAFEVLTLLGRFWKKYASWGGRSWRMSGLGVRFLALVILPGGRPRFEVLMPSITSTVSVASSSSPWSSSDP